MTRFNRRVSPAEENSEVRAACRKKARNRGDYGRASVRSDFHLPAGHAGSGHRQDYLHHRAAATEKGAKIEKTEKWGRKRMAYRVSGCARAFTFTWTCVRANGEVVKELERRLKVSDAVIKYLTIRVDEELKRQEKLKRHRERRAARRPRKTAAGAAGASRRPASKRRSNLIREKSNGRRTAHHSSIFRTAVVSGHSGAPGRGGPRPRAAGQARRPGEARQAEFRPQKESLPLLRRQSRLHRLQEGRSSRRRSFRSAERFFRAA